MDITYTDEVIVNWDEVIFAVDVSLETELLEIGLSNFDFWINDMLFYKDIQDFFERKTLPIHVLDLYKFSKERAVQTLVFRTNLSSYDREFLLKLKAHLKRFFYKSLKNFKTKHNIPD